MPALNKHKLPVDRPLAGSVYQSSTGAQIKVRRTFNGKVYGTRRRSGRGRWSKAGEVDLTGYVLVE